MEQGDGSTGATDSTNTDSESVNDEVSSAEVERSEPSKGVQSQSGVDHIERECYLVTNSNQNSHESEENDHDQNGREMQNTLGPFGDATGTSKLFQSEQRYPTGGTLAKSSKTPENSETIGPIVTISESLKAVTEETNIFSDRLDPTQDESSSASSTESLTDLTKSKSAGSLYTKPLPDFHLVSDMVGEPNTNLCPDGNADNAPANHAVRAGSIPSAAGDASEPSGEDEQDPPDDSSTISHILPATVRDANTQSGQRDADEVYQRFFKECYPEYKTKVYRVPPLHISHPQCKKSADLQSRLTESFKVFGTTRSDIQGDNAEQTVADCIESLLTEWTDETERYPAFVITSFRFENFCNRRHKPPTSDENKYVEEQTTDTTTTLQEPKTGEHDILIVHYKFGIIYIQIKSCEQTDPKEPVKYAIKQTEKDIGFFKANFGDLNLELTNSIKTCIALPNMTREQLQAKYKICWKKIEEKCGVKMCLFKEDLPKKDDTDKALIEKKRFLLRWLENITSTYSGFKSYDDYKRVVARYIGFKSTVRIRHLTHSVAHIGNKYMNIALTPQQVYILSTDLPRLVIRGQYGAGKTIMLILKARQMIKEKKVCVVSMSPSPLIHVLEASIKHDLKPEYFGNIVFETALDQSSLAEVLQKSGLEGRHVLIDEFPSFLFADKTLKETIHGYPSNLIFWCITSREKNNEMSIGTAQLFTISEKMFNEVVLGKILRCPPTVQALVPKDSQKRSEKVLLTYKPENIQSDQTVGKIANYLHSLGLSTDETRRYGSVDPKSLSLKWKDLAIIVSETEGRPFYKQLEDLKIPLRRISDVASFSKTDVDHVKSNDDTPFNMAAAYTRTVDGFQNAKQMAVIEETRCAIYIRGNTSSSIVVQLKMTEVAKFLFENHFRNDIISKACKGEVTTKHDISRKWCDLIFVDEGEVVKPEIYTVFEDLGVPLVTPCIRDVISKDAALYTNRSEYEGMKRTETITFEQSTITTKGKEKIRVTANEEDIKRKKILFSCEPEKLDQTAGEIANYLHSLGLSTEENCRYGSDDPSNPSLKWKDLAIIVPEIEDGLFYEGKIYTVFEGLGIPLVTNPPCSGDVISQDAALYTNRSGYEGLKRKETITFEQSALGNGKITITANEEEIIREEGPAPIHVDHTNHEGQLDTCDLCKGTLKKTFVRLGMLTFSSETITAKRVTRPTTQESGAREGGRSIQPSDSRGVSQNILARARLDLSLADLVILDNRANPKSAVKLFEGYGLPVVDRLASNSLDADDAFGSETKVIYTKPHLFKGLERKVVVVLKNRNPSVVSLMKGGVIEDDIEVSITRCASQLIMIWN